MATFRVFREFCDYDEYDAFVVISDSATEAGDMVWAAYGKGGYPRQLGVKNWHEFVARWKVIEETEPGIILGSYHAG